MWTQYYISKIRYHDNYQISANKPLFFRRIRFIWFCINSICKSKKYTTFFSGFKVVVRVYFDHRFCALNRYQPFVFRTNGSSECTFQKSLCSGEGQIIVTDKYLVTRTDTTCRCDYERGYSFIIQPNNIAHCVPSEEDCSCYNKLCNDGYILNAGTSLWTYK